MLRTRLKQLCCKHDYKPWANTHGDWIQAFGWKRTILICTKCGKRKFINEYIPAPLDAGSLYNYIALKKEGDPCAEMFFEDIIKDQNLFNELFGGKQCT